MTSPSKRKGDAAELEAARLIADLIGRPVERALGAGRKTDTGDIFGVPSGSVTKTCKSCGLLLPVERFNSDHGTRDGLRGQCKGCRATQKKSLRAMARLRINGDEGWHGTTHGYSNNSCRCDPCRAAFKAYSDEWRKRPHVAIRLRQQQNESARKPENRERKRAKQYGLSVKELSDRLASGICSACGSREPGDTAWSIDHDHSCCPGRRACGKCVRGILCKSCNSVLGLLNDDQRRLTALIEYLNTWYGR